MNQYLINLLYPFIFTIMFVIIRVLYIILTFIPEKMCHINAVKEYFDEFKAYYADKEVPSNILYIFYRALSIRAPCLGFQSQGSIAYNHDFRSGVLFKKGYKIIFTIIAVILLSIISLFVYLKVPIISSCSAICLTIGTTKFLCGVLTGIYALIMFYYKKRKLISKLFIEPDIKVDILKEVIGDEKAVSFIQLRDDIKEKPLDHIKQINLLYKKLLDFDHDNKPSVISYISLLVLENKITNPILIFFNNISNTSGTRYLFFVVLICTVINSSFSMAYTLTKSKSNSPTVNDIKYVGLSASFLIVLMLSGWIIYDFSISCCEFIYQQIYNTTNNTFADYILEIYRICLFDCTSHIDVVYRLEGFKERFKIFIVKCCCPVLIAILIAFFLTLSIQLCQINADAKNSPIVANQLYSQPNIKTQYDLGFMSTMKSTTIVSVIIISVFLYLEYLGLWNISSHIMFLLACLVVIVIVVPIVMFVYDKYM